jgi:hypothetical protein
VCVCVSRKDREEEECFCVCVSRTERDELIERWQKEIEGHLRRRDTGKREIEKYLEIQ